MKEHILQQLSMDPSGLIWAFYCQKSAPVNALSLSEVPAIAKDVGDKKSGFVWLHFNLSQAGTEKWLRENTQLPIEFYEALQQGSRSTRVELVDDNLLAVVNDVLHEFSFNPHETSTLWLSVTPHMVISARRKPLKSVDRLRQAVQAGARMEPMY
jgi:zinc transporter